MDNIKNINQFIESTLLKPDTSFLQIENLCLESIKNNFYGVCVNPMFVSYAKTILKGSSIKIVTVIGFPLGANAALAKISETKIAVQDGADEIDMVIALGALKSGKLEYVENDIRNVVVAAEGRPVKVIIETALLDEAEKRQACELSLKAGAHFVKTCTGFSGGAATVDDIRLMKSIVGNRMGVKASGGVKNIQQAQSLINAGANRIGTSSGVDIVLGLISSPSGGY